MLKAWRDLERKVGLPLLREVVEHFLLGPLPGPRWLAGAVLSGRLNTIRPLLDSDFYLRQIPIGWSRRAAERDAALHYHLLGRFHNFAPHPDFDPIAYRHDHPDLTWTDDPLLDFGRRSGLLDWTPTPRKPIRSAGRNGTVVTLHHARGGGSNHYLDLLEGQLRERGHNVVRLVRLALSAPLFRAEPPQQAGPKGAIFDLVAEPEALFAALQSLQAVRLIVNHAVDLPPEALELISASCVAASIPFEVHLHDYYYLCPRIDLVDADGSYCGAPRDHACVGCALRQLGQPTWTRSAWREATRQFLGAADMVIGPSRDVAARYTAIWPELRIEVRCPEDDSDVLAPHSPRISYGEPITVAVLGRLNIAKGFEVVMALAGSIRRQGAPVRLILIGQSINDAALRRRGVLVHGRYRADEGPALLNRYAPHLVFLPPIWPETWSFVLSLALRARVPVVAFDLGAVAERLNRLGIGTLLPLDCAAQPDRLLDLLIETARHGRSSDVAKTAACFACS